MLDEDSAFGMLVEAFPPTGEVEPADWTSVEAELGVALPADFTRLCDAFADERLHTSKSNVRLWCPQSRWDRSRFPAGALRENKRLERDLRRAPSAVIETIGRVGLALDTEDLAALARRLADAHGLPRPTELRDSRLGPVIGLLEKGRHGLWVTKGNYDLGLGTA